VGTPEQQREALRIVVGGEAPARTSAGSRTFFGRQRQSPETVPGLDQMESLPVEAVALEDRIEPGLNRLSWAIAT
jgi:hypothetical protein